MVYATLIGVALATSALPVGPDVQSKAARVKSAELDDFALKLGRVTFNNFCVGEVANRDMPNGRRFLNGFDAVTIRGSYRNRSAEGLPFTLVVVGVDDEGEVLWACTISGVAADETVGIFDEQVAVHPGVLKRTASLRIRAHVGPLPPTGPTVVPPNLRP